MPALDRVTLVTPESLKEAIAGFGAPSDGRLGITEKKKQGFSNQVATSVVHSYKEIEHQTMSDTRTDLL